MKKRNHTDAMARRSFELRWHFVVGCLLLGGVVLAARAVHLQVFNTEFLTKQADVRHLRVAKISTHRGVITDRNGEPLASLLRRRLLRQTRGLRPDELRVMYEHHDAILHSVSEGLIVLGGDGVLVINDEAHRLLGLPVAVRVERTVIPVLGGDLGERALGGAGVVHPSGRPHREERGRKHDVLGAHPPPLAAPEPAHPVHVVEAERHGHLDPTATDCVDRLAECTRTRG